MSYKYRPYSGNKIQHIDGSSKYLYVSAEHVLSILSQLDIHMNAEYCTWFRYPTAQMSLPETETEKTGDSIYSGRKIAAGKKISWESYLHSQIWAVA